MFELIFTVALNVGILAFIISTIDALGALKRQQRELNDAVRRLDEKLDALVAASDAQSHQIEPTIV